MGPQPLLEHVEAAPLRLHRRDQVISEIKECLQTYPDVTVRVIAFDRQRRCRSPGSSSRSKRARFGRPSGPFVLTGSCIRYFVLLAAPPNAGRVRGASAVHFGGT